MRDNYEKEVGGDQIDKIIKFIRKNRMQSFYNLMLIVIILIQTPFMIAGLDSVTVEIDMPPRGKIIVTNDSANELYYRMWAEHFTNNEKYFFAVEKGLQQNPYTYSLVDFDYTNVEQKYTKFLKLYKPSKLLKDRQIYQAFIKNVKVKMISQNYTVERILVDIVDDGNKAKKTILGVSTQRAASTIIGEKSCKYEMTFERIGGKIYATSLNTDCF